MEVSLLFYSGDFAPVGFAPGGFAPEILLLDNPGLALTRERSLPRLVELS